MYILEYFFYIVCVCLSIDMGCQKLIQLIPHLLDLKGLLSNNVIYRIFANGGWKNINNGK